MLNRSGKLTGRGNNWTRTRVCSVRSQKGIAAYREGEREERGEVTLNEAAEMFAISPSTIRRMIGGGLLPAQQFCKGAPWIIPKVALHREEVTQEARRRRTRCPSSQDLNHTAAAGEDG